MNAKGATPKLRVWPILLVAILSVLAGVTIVVAQDRNLGDRPEAMLITGSALAVITTCLGVRPPLLVGCAAMFGFPALAVLDIVWNGGGSHNLLPFEFFLYGLYALAGILVAVIVEWVLCIQRRRNSL
ncbi:MAG: hypothetical protein H6832_04335 [Planctomycetes bacterium]|nr:hypothetical protein [Planctomycetota bacterium]